MANDIILLKNTCEQAENELKALSMQLLALCEKTLNKCSARINSFGEIKGKTDGAEMIDICARYIKEANSIYDSALNCINVIYCSVIRYNELGSTPLYKSASTYSPTDIFTYSFFFTLANEIGNVFEDVYEKDIQNALNNIVSGLNIDNDGDKIDAKVVISGIKQIANFVSKATKFYFNED